MALKSWKKTLLMLVVSDVDVLICLSKLDKLSNLRSLYVEVVIPEYVRSEITGKDNLVIHEAIDSLYTAKSN
jgi:predicted nucleic acid-binding protein